MAWIAEQWEQMRGNIKWDISKMIGALVLGAMYVVFQKARGLTWDWWVFGGILTVSLVLLILLNRPRKTKLVVDTTTSKGSAPKLAIHRAVYAAGLQTEVSVTDQLRNLVRDAIVIPVDSTLGGLIPDPAFGVRKCLDVDYSYGSDTVFHVSRLEPRPGEITRLVLPEDTEVAKLRTELEQLKTAQPRTQYPIPAVRLKVLGMCSELQGFLGAHGREPEVKRELPESQDAFMRRWRSIVPPWRAKFIGDYRLTFGDSVPRLRDEIRLRAGIDDFTLNDFIHTAETDPNGNVQAVMGITKRFWEIALDVNV